MIEAPSTKLATRQVFNQFWMTETESGTNEHTSDLQ